MNPAASIALITKLKLIFETDAEGNPQSDKFLAFQNGAFPVAKENFYFMEPDKYKLGPIDTALKMVDFANTFNFIAATDDFISPTDNELNDVYHHALKTAIAAISTRTPQQEKEYEAAQDFLSHPIQASDGQTITRLANYSNYENLYKEVLSEYKNRQLAANHAQGDDAAFIKAQWETDKPQLKRDISIALLNWETLGNRKEVEKHLSKFMLLTGSSPGTTIADLQMDYEQFANSETLDHLANELNYLPTYFTPLNFFDKKVSWQSMSLDKSEVNALVKQAPERLKNLFDMNGKDAGINNISFEYIVVEIVREWLHYKDFLLQHFWKQPQDQEPLSDGKGNGKLPAFPEKIIFVRKVKIETLREHGVPKSDPKARLTSQLFLKLKPHVLRNLQKEKTRIKKRKVNLPQLKKSLQKDTLFSAKTIAQIKPVKSFGIFQTLSAPAGRPKPRVKGKKKAAKAVMLKAAFRKPIITNISVRPAKGKVTDTATSRPKNTITEHKELELLGFICRNVPLCADPDPKLQWD